MVRKPQKKFDGTPWHACQPDRWSVSSWPNTELGFAVPSPRTSLEEPGRGSEAPDPVAQFSWRPKMKSKGDVTMVPFTPVIGERSINNAEAAIVRRIFEEFAIGRSPRAIAQSLNKDDIPGPAGRSWGPSTIYGHWERGTGVLNNELYIGRLVWNR